jgi:hypothetical protein
VERSSRWGKSSVTQMMVYLFFYLRSEMIDKTLAEDEKMSSSLNFSHDFGEK